MKFKDTDEFFTRNCGICGEYIGGGFDHSGCSKIKQETYAGTNERKNPKKRLSESNINYLSRTT